jgi:DNA-binding NarL/FixJ family response regulator
MPEDAKKEGIRVMIVDDHGVARSGIRLSLKSFADIQVVAEAESGEEALQFCRETELDVVLMDLAMPEMDGITAACEIIRSHPHVAVIALSGSENQRVVQDALQAGAVMCLCKNVAIDELAAAIRASYHGRGDGNASRNP